MKRLLFLFIMLMSIQLNGLRCYGQNNQTAKVRPSIVFYASYPMALLQETLLITPELDYYFQKKSFGTLRVFHCKITESQYQESLSDIDLSDMRNIHSSDTIIYSKCEGVDDSPSGTIIIKVGEYRMYYIGKCTIPNGFDHLFAFVKENRPRLKNNKMELTRKSSKTWKEVSEIPAQW